MCTSPFNAATRTLAERDGAGAAASCAAAATCASSSRVDASRALLKKIAGESGGIDSSSPATYVPRKHAAARAFLPVSTADHDTCRPAAHAIRAAVAAPTPAHADHNACGGMQQHNTHDCCSSSCVARSIFDFPPRRGSGKTCTLASAPPDTPLKETRVREEVQIVGGECGFTHHSCDTKMKSNSGCLTEPACPGADASVEVADARRPLLAQGMVAADPSHFVHRGTASPATSPQGIDGTAACPDAALAVSIRAAERGHSRASTLSASFGAVAMKGDVCGEYQTQLVGGNDPPSRECVRSAGEPIAGVVNTEEAARAAAGATGASREMATAEVRKTQKKQRGVLSVGRHEKSDSTYTTGTCSYVFSLSSNTTSCCSTGNANGRSGSMASVPLSRSNFVTPAKRSRSLAVAGAAVTLVNEKESATLKSPELHARVLKRQPSSNDQRQKCHREHNQLPRRTRSFPVAVSKRQTQIVDYFTAEKHP